MMETCYLSYYKLHFQVPNNNSMNKDWIWTKNKRSAGLKMSIFYFKYKVVIGIIGAILKFFCSIKLWLFMLRSAMIISMLRYLHKLITFVISHFWWCSMLYSFFLAGHVIWLDSDLWFFVVSMSEFFLFLICLHFLKCNYRSLSIYILKHVKPTRHRIA